MAPSAGRTAVEQLLERRDVIGRFVHPHKSYLRSSRDLSRRRALSGGRCRPRRSKLAGPAEHKRDLAVDRPHYQSTRR